MYDRDDVELLLPSICWTHHLHPEMGEYGRTHECARDESYWVNPPRKKRKGSVQAETTRIYHDWLTPAEVADLEDGPEKKRWTKVMELSCDPSDRKGFSNPKFANTVWAELVDIQIAWDKAPLTTKERISLYLRYAMRWTEEEIGFNQNVTQQTISERLDRALVKLQGRLNHGIWQTLELVEA